MFKLKPAEEKDAVAIAAIQVNTWKDCYSGLMPESFLNAYRVTAESIAHWQNTIARGGHCQIAETAAGEYAGYLLAGASRFPHIPYLTEIYSFYVLPRYQHQQVGSLLFNHFHQSQKGKGFFVCAVKGNKAAENFYLKKGGRHYPEYAFVSSTNKFPVHEEVFAWGNPEISPRAHRPGAAVNPEFW